MNKFLSIFAAIVAATALTAGNASAQSDDINPWQECGLGAMVFPENGTAAAISNIIWDLGTTAVTSMVSTPESCEGANVQTAMFIQQTYAELELETAKGEGEYLATAAEMMGCSDAAQATVISQVRSDLAGRAAEPTFTAMTHSEKAEAFYLSMNSAAKATGMCQA